MNLAQYEVYTDGSCIDNPGGPGGWGFLLVHNGKETSLFGGTISTTNNKMEMLAAIKALESIDEPSTVVVYTDSKYLINGITKWARGWKRNGWKLSSGKTAKNIELWERLMVVSDKHAISWRWVRGHSGDRGNEIADELARMGTQSAMRGEI